MIIRDGWTPLRCSWGSASGDSSASTGGGDWGSAGTYDASSFNADAGNALFGGSFDASIFGSGMGGGGDWGSFGAYSAAGGNIQDPNNIDTSLGAVFDAPYATASTGGGDWGSFGSYSSGLQGTGEGAGYYGGGGGGYYGGGGGLFGGRDDSGYGGGGGGGRSGGGVFTSDSGGGRSGGGRAGGEAAPLGGAARPSSDTTDTETGGEAAPLGGAEPESSDEPATGSPAGLPSQAGSDEGGGAEPSGDTETSQTETSQPQQTEGSRSEGLGRLAEAMQNLTQDEGQRSDAVVAAVNQATQNTDYKSAADIIASDLRAEQQQAPEAYQPSQQDYSQLTQDESQRSDRSEAPQYYDIGAKPFDFSITPQGEKGVNQLYDTLVANNPLNPWSNQFLQFQFPTNQPTTNFNIANIIANHPLNPWNPNNVYPSLPYYPGFEGYPTEDQANQAAQPAAQPVDVEDSGPAPAQSGAQQVDEAGMTFPSGAQQVDETGMVFNPSEFAAGQPGMTNFEGANPFFGPGQTQGGQFFDPLGYDPSSGAAYSPDSSLTAGSDPALSGAAAGDAAAQSGAPPQAADAAAQAAAGTAARGGDPADQANAAAQAARDAGATKEQADAIAGAVYDAATSQATTIAGKSALYTLPPIDPAVAIANWGYGTRAAEAQQALTGLPTQRGTTDQTLPPEQAQQQEAQAAPPPTEQPQAPPEQAQTAPPPQVVTDVTTPQSLLELGGVPPAQPAPPPTEQSQALPPQEHAEANPPGEAQAAPPATEQNRGEGAESNTPPTGTPPGRSWVPVAPPGQSSATRPPPTAQERSEFTNWQLDRPANPFYQDRGIWFPQGQPGRAWQTAEQAGIHPLFDTRDHNWRSLDARLVERLNRAYEAMPADIRSSFALNSAYRPATRADARSVGMSDFQSQESVYARGHAPGGRHFAAARPGNSNHGHGRAVDVQPGAALNWLQAHGRQFGLTGIGRGDWPHIQMMEGGARAQPGRFAQRSAAPQIPLPRARPGGAPVGDPTAPRPPADIPPAPPVSALPPQTQAVETPIAPPTTPPARGMPDPAMMSRTASQIAQDMAARGPRPTSQAAGQAALSSLANALGRASISSAIARQTLTEIARAGARSAGYDPDGIASSFISSMVNTALQNYRAAPFAGEVQGPHAPRGLAKGGHVEKGEQVMVGEEGPETFVPDEPGTVVPYVPPGSTQETFGRWPRLSLPGASPGTIRHIGLGGYIQNQIANQQYPTGLLQMLNDGTLRINPQNWNRMLADPRLQAMGRARIEDRRDVPSY